MGRPRKNAGESSDVSGAPAVDQVEILFGHVGGFPGYAQGEIVDASVFPELDRLIEIGAVKPCGTGTSTTSEPSETKPTAATTVTDIPGLPPAKDVPFD